MEEQSGEDLTPFWLQGSTSFSRSDHHRRRRSSSPFLNSGLLLILLLVTAILFIIFILPSIVSFTSQIFRPNLVKKSWDSLNLLLVLFAIVFAFLSRNRNEDTTDHHQSTYLNIHEIAPKSNSNSSTPRQWYEYSADRTVYNTAGVNGNGLSLRRNSSSYPDLREASPWLAGDDRWRFYDDTDVDSYQSSEFGHLRRRHSRREVEAQSPDSKTVRVDTFLNRPKEVIDGPPHSSPPPPPPPPPAAVVVSAVKQRPKRTHQNLAHEKKKVNNEPESNKFVTPTAEPPPISAVKQRPPKRTHQILAHEEKKVNDDPESEKLLTPPAEPPPISAVKQRPIRTYHSVANEEKTNEEVSIDSETKRSLRASSVPPPPPPPLPPPELHYYSEKSKKGNRKRDGGNATKEFLTSLYHKRKKKKQRPKSVENFEDLLRSQYPPFLQQPSTPPPPPPPPPPSVFHNLFSSKKNKHERSHSDPPPDFPSPAELTASRASKTTPRKPPITAHRPPIPVTISTFNNADETSNSGNNSPLIGNNKPHFIGNESPLIPIPPPPPPPPFKMPAWKFVVQGDYVRVQSDLSSSSGSPDLEDVESPQSSASPAAIDCGDSMFCPSPDVDTKADNFIARFRAGLKLEKNNSIKQRQGLGLSNLGP